MWGQEDSRADLLLLPSLRQLPRRHTCSLASGGGGASLVCWLAEARLLLLLLLRSGATCQGDCRRKIAAAFLMVSCAHIRLDVCQPLLLHYLLSCFAWTADSDNKKHGQRWSQGLPRGARDSL